MPCENCNTQFSVFKRKKTCTECSRLFCNQCLIKRKEKILCERCVVFTKRPLTKIELLKLKPKDLIFYLQSKHISTTGCVEKEELVNLILEHINANNYQDNHNPLHHNNGNSGTNNSSENCSNPFDQIKQTCQNLFHSFTEKIEIPFDYFDIKSPQSTSNGQQQQQQHSQTNIYTQSCSLSSTNINNQYQQQQQRLSNNYINTTTNTNDLNSSTTMTTNNDDDGSINTNINENNITSNRLSSPDINVNNINSPASSSSQSTPIPDLPKNGISINEKSCTSIKHQNQININDLPSVNTTINSNKKYKLLTHLNDITACNCSDDESFKNLKLKYEEHCLKNNLPGPSGNKISNNNPNKKLNTSESSESLSSFEELGAAGGIVHSSCSNKYTTLINDGIAECSIANTNCASGASSDRDNWQFIDKTDGEYKKKKVNTSYDYDNDADDDDDDGYFDDKNIKANDNKFVYNYYLSKQKTAEANKNKKPKHSIDDSETNINKKNDFLNKLLIERNHRKITRRLSDSYILGKNQKKQKLKTYNDGYNNIDGKTYVQTDNEDTINDSNDDDNNNDEQITIIHCCNKCGKSKNSIKKHILKFRKQLEIKTITESEKSKQLNDFLLYLEEKTKNSFDFSDDSISEDLITTNTSNPTTNITNLANDEQQQRMPQSTTRITINNIDNDQFYEDDLILENDVVHVNPINNIYNNVPNNMTSPKKESIRKYLKLNDISSSDQLENLSVKQLKEILILNRVDFKGCCEKNELLERAQRLWNDYVSCPTADKLPTDDLCKICMDAPIECVILECGHLATCTDCGKVLSECPICRQYVVRVVRIFRA